MKKVVALVLVCLFCVASAYAAEWADGLSPAQPYSGKPEINLNETMGYMTLYPNVRRNIVAERFCDVLEMYFPREDIVLGEGNLTLCDESGEVVKVSFADPNCVELRPLEELELEGLLWGSGSCIEIHLPVSLRFDTAYYVLMDEGCFSAADGKVVNPQISSQEAWIPQVVGDYGIGGLYYSTPLPEPADDEEEAAQKELPVEYKSVPEVGDAIHFDLVMGGDAKTAVVYSENDSVLFKDIEYSESCTVTGTITGEELDWGVVFLNEAGEVLYIVDLK
ncbi:MAG: hypothetical protein IJ124_08820 [Clostridia bacterium]|nr:hypothetical protein [Clostridia bacterium]